MELAISADGPLHDWLGRRLRLRRPGATIINGDRITMVGALLPLSNQAGLPAAWGTRHRAAMGLSECSDAVVVVASEERHTVTLIHDGIHREVESL